MDTHSRYDFIGDFLYTYCTILKVVTCGPMHDPNIFDSVQNIPRGILSTHKSLSTKGD